MTKKAMIITINLILTLSVLPVLGSDDFVLRINAGGPKFDDNGIVWNADDFYSSSTKTYSITATDIANTDRDAIYLNERCLNDSQESFSYRLPVPQPGIYTVNLHFAEIFWQQAGKRIFNVNIEGGDYELTDFDIVAEVGFKTAIVKTFETQTNDNVLEIVFEGAAEKPKISAIEVFTNDTVEPTPSPLNNSVIWRINSGGPSIVSNNNTWGADSLYSGGLSNSVNLFDIANTNDDSVYCSERHGNFSYCLPVSPCAYVVNLFFAEIFWNDVGKRIFDIEIEGQMVALDFDILEHAAKNSAFVKSFLVTVDDGFLNLSFASVKDRAKLSGIEVLIATAPDETATPTPTASGTSTSTPTPINTATSTWTSSSTPTPSSSLTATPTSTYSSTLTPTWTNTPTASSTSSSTATSTATKTATETPTPIPPSQTPTEVDTSTPMTPSNSIQAPSNAYFHYLKLEWDPVDHPGLSGYTIYYGYAPNDYPFSIAVGNVTAHTFTNLKMGRNYWFVVTARTTDGTESGFSNSVCSYINPSVIKILVTDITGLSKFILKVGSHTVIDDTFLSPEAAGTENPYVADTGVSFQRYAVLMNVTMEDTLYIYISDLLGHETLIEKPLTEIATQPLGNEEASLSITTVSENTSFVSQLPTTAAPITNQVQDDSTEIQSPGDTLPETEELLSVQELSLADLNKDGKVNAEDLFLFQEEWHQIRQ